MRSEDAHDESELLWEMGRKGPAEGCAHLPGHDLVAYRDGRLPAEVSEEIERALGRDSEARARMAELAELAPAAPAPWVRDAVLKGFDESVRRGAASAHGLWLKAAAIAVVGLGMLLLMQLSLVTPAPAPLPVELSYDVVAEGLATIRQSPPGGREIEAFPETRVRITASPRAAAVQEIEFALYRENARRLERLEPGVSFGVETIRGAAVVTALAGDLVAPEAESTRLFLVVARPGDFPSTLELGSSTAADALEDVGRRRAYPVVIHLRSAAP